MLSFGNFRFFYVIVCDHTYPGDFKCCDGILWLIFCVGEFYNILMPFEWNVILY